MLVPAHCGMEPSGKKKPFDPLSMKLAFSDCWLKFVVKLSKSSIVNTVAVLGTVLFDWVPIPKISEPEAVAALAPSDCIWTITPLLSVGKSTTGLTTCCASATCATWQFPVVEQAKETFGGVIPEAGSQA